MTFTPHGADTRHSHQRFDNDTSSMLCDFELTCICNFLQIHITKVQIFSQVARNAEHRFNRQV